MPLVAVTGIPGSGKSTVLAALKARGLVAFGTDEDGLAEAVHLYSERLFGGYVAAEPVTAGLDFHGRRGVLAWVQGSGDAPVVKMSALQTPGGSDVLVASC